MSQTLRILADDEIEYVAGGSMDEIVVYGYYSPWSSYMSYDYYMWIYGSYYVDPYAAYYYSDAGGSGGGGGSGGADLDTNNDGANDIAVKDGVNPDTLSSQMQATFDEVVSAWATHAPGTQPVITSTNDGNHMQGSLHFTNNAMDLRGNNISDATGYAIASALQQALGSNYDVAFEVFPNSPSNDHIHIEYDPN